MYIFVGIYVQVPRLSELRACSAQFQFVVSKNFLYEQFTRSRTSNFTIYFFVFSRFLTFQKSKGEKREKLPT